jgi:hypothetical protein
MADPLAIYLHDHLAGSSFAIELFKSLRDEHLDDPVGQLATTLRTEIEEDRVVLQRIIDRVGKRPPDLKEAAAWLSEKVSRFKLRHSAAGGLGTFEALETLALGILGKLALWRALAVIADARVHGVDFEQLITRAQAQHARLEESRLQVARTLFEATPE